MGGSPEGGAALEEALTAMFGSAANVEEVCFVSVAADGRCAEVKRSATALSSHGSLILVDFRVDVEFGRPTNVTDVLATVEQLESGSEAALGEFAIEFEATFARLDLPVQVLNVLQTPQPPQAHTSITSALPSESSSKTDEPDDDAIALIAGLAAGAALLLFGLVFGVILVRWRRKAERASEPAGEDARVDSPYDAVVLPDEAMGTPVKIMKVEPVSDEFETPCGDGTVQFGDAEEMTNRDACAALDEYVCKDARCAISSDSLSTCIDSQPLDGVLSQSSLVPESEWDKTSKFESHRPGIPHSEPAQKT